MVKEECRLHLDRAMSFYLSGRSTLDRAAVIEATRAKTTNPKKLKLIDWRLKGLDKIMEGCHKEFENSIDRLINCECGEFTVKTGNPGESKGEPRYVYGTESREWHMIYPGDRDYDQWGLTKEQMEKAIREGKTDTSGGMRSIGGVPYHGDLYDVVEAQVKQGKDINAVKKIVGGIWDDTTDAQIESAFRDAKVIHEHMKAKHPELMN